MMTKLYQGSESPEKLILVENERDLAYCFKNQNTIVFRTIFLPIKMKNDLI